ncbi:TBPIP-domain-containing protein [Rhizoctonia solani]|nr:TBPIP-domain-containing protein [Rhizoctonia solani]
MVPEKEKTPQLKGKDAEDAVLKYLKKANRPYGSSDISANLKNAVTKAATQKILLSLAERELVTQKTYGKATYFVAPQTTAEELAPSEIDSLASELEKTRELVKERTGDVKRLTAELAKVKSSPTDDELERMIQESEEQIQLLIRALAPLRIGQAPISESDLAQLDADWIRWRAEWVDRKKVFKMLWDIRSDSLSSSEAAELLEDLGVEQDTPEHVELEKSELCTKFKAKK